MTNLGNSLDNAKVYVGTYKKYNEGSIFGEWLNLKDYAEYGELFAKMKEVHSDEDDPEFMFQDYEVPSFFVSVGLIAECYLSPDIYKAIETVENSGYDIEVWEAFWDCFGMSKDFEEVSELISDNYEGEFNSDEDFVEELLYESGSIPELPPYIHINWTKTSYDIMMDYSTSNGHYFRNF